MTAEIESGGRARGGVSYDDIRAIMSAIGELRELVVGLGAKIDHIAPMVAEHDRSLRGSDGAVGLVSRISALETSVANLGAQAARALELDNRLRLIEERQESDRTTRRMVLAALLTGIVSILVDIIMIVLRQLGHI